MPRTQEVAIFVLTNRQTNRQTEPIALPPCACVRGNKAMVKKKAVSQALPPQNLLQPLFSSFQVPN